MKLLIFLTEQETKEFCCWAEFLAWKENKEVISHCHFVQPTEKTSSAKSQIKTCMLMSVVMHLISGEKCIVVYTCCRDGGYKGCDRERKTSKNSSLSHQLFGTQDEDDTIRFVVSNMVSRNKEIFLPFFIPTANINSLDQHCARMWISIWHLGYSGRSSSCSNSFYDTSVFCYSIKRRI